MTDSLLRLRINYTKQGRLRYLSHLELTRTVERLIRRADLPFAVSQGFNSHMRYASGPALPVGTEGLDEYFDVFLTEYLDPSLIFRQLESSTVHGMEILSVNYVDTRAKGLQATHIYEDYWVIFESPSVNAQELEGSLRSVINQGFLIKKKKHTNKTYNLSKIIDSPLAVFVEASSGVCLIHMKLKSGDEGSIRPDLLIEAAMGEKNDWKILAVTRVRLAETKE